MTDSRVDTIVVCALNSTICLIEIETSNNTRFVIEANMSVLFDFGNVTVYLGTNWDYTKHCIQSTLK